MESWKGTGILRGCKTAKGSARGHHDRGGYHTGRPRTPPHRPWLRGVSPQRSPRLQRVETVGDLRRLPIAAKPSSCRMAHSRSTSENERGLDSRSSQSSSDQGRPERMELTPPELVDFTVYDFTAVSHTTNSILFTSGHPYIPGWVLIWGVTRPGPGSASSVPQRPGTGGGDQEAQETGGRASPRAKISKAGGVEEGLTGGLGGVESVSMQPG